MPKIGTSYNKDVTLKNVYVNTDIDLNELVSELEQLDYITVYSVEPSIEICYYSVIPYEGLFGIFSLSDTTGVYYIGFAKWMLIIVKYEEDLPIVRDIFETDFIDAPGIYTLTFFVDEETGEDSRIFAKVDGTGTILWISESEILDSGFNLSPDNCADTNRYRDISSLLNFLSFNEDFSDDQDTNQTTSEEGNEPKTYVGRLKKFIANMMK